MPIDHFLRFLACFNQGRNQAGRGRCASPKIAWVLFSSVEEYLDNFTSKKFFECLRPPN